MPIAQSANLTGFLGDYQSGTTVYGTYTNTGTTPIAKGQLVTIVSCSPPQCRAMASTDTRGQSFGVALEPIPAGGAGDVATGGDVNVVITGAAVSAGSQLVPDLTGLVGVVAASGTAVIKTIGVAYTSSSGAGGTISARLQGGVFPV